MLLSLRTPIAAVLMALFASASLGQPGSYSKVSTTDINVIAAANFAIETQSKKEPVTLIKILSAESQVVAGRNTRMTLEVRTKSGVHQALAVVWTKIDRTRELTTWEIKPGETPEKPGDNTPDGGYTEVATTNKSVMVAADFAIEAHSKKFPVTLVKIEKAESQVVAGRNYRMTLEVRMGRMKGSMHVVAVVWAKLDGTHQLTSWEAKENVAPVKQDDGPKGPKPGGSSEIPTTGPDAVEAAKFAIETYSKKEPVTLIKILAASGQVVNGYITRLKLEVRTKDGVREAAAAVLESAVPNKKSLMNWEWIGEARPEKRNDGPKEPRLGGYSPVATTDSGVVAAANFAIETYSKKEPVTLVKIENAESQVVAGRNTSMLLEVRTRNGLRQAKAIVWHKLDGTRELTSWEWKTAAAPKKGKS